MCNIEVTDNGEAVECDECQVNEAYRLRRVQALGDTSRSALWCHNNEIRTSMANLPNTAQLERIPYHSLTYIWVRGVLWNVPRNREADTRTAVTNVIHFAAPHAKCKKYDQFVTTPSDTTVNSSHDFTVTSWLAPLFLWIEADAYKVQSYLNFSVATLWQWIK